MPLSVRVTTRAQKSEVIPPEGDGPWKVKVNTPPVNGAANRKVIEILAKYFGVAKSSVRILKGDTCRNKIVEIGK